MRSSPPIPDESGQIPFEASGVSAAIGALYQGITLLTSQEAEMSVMTSRVATTAVLILIGASTGSAQSSTCTLLTSAESIKHIARGQKTYNQTPDAITVAGGAGALCEYPYGGQIGVWKGPSASENFEGFLKIWKADKETRHPVPDVGDRAWIMFPVPEDKYKDRTAYLVSYVGDKVVTVALFARNGQADGVMGEVCRGDQSRLKPKEKEECKTVLADRSETQESLKPAVIELAKMVVERVRAGK